MCRSTIVVPIDGIDKFLFKRVVLNIFQKKLKPFLENFDDESCEEELVDPVYGDDNGASAQ